MQCSKCRSGAILFQPYSGQHLCREHFILDFEAKAKRTVRHQGGIRPKDSIAVPLAGDYAVQALLVFLKKIAGNRRDIRFAGIAMTGSPGYPAAGEPDAVFTKIAIPTALEESSASALTRILQGRADLLHDKAGAGIPVLAPFSHIPATEVMLYASLHGIDGKDAPEIDEDPLQADVRALLGEYTRSHPHAPYAVLALCDALGSCDRHFQYEQTYLDRQSFGE